MSRPNPAEPDRQNEGWERELVRDLAREALRERRTARRWNLFFRALLFLYVGVVTWMIWEGGKWRGDLSGEHAAVVEIRGLIAEGSAANARDVIEGLTDAFEHAGTRGVILRINSPGGSAVQAALVHDKLLELREQHPDIPVVAVVTDAAASGAYYIAVAAERIYANRASIVGSIGVRLDSFGLVGTLDKLGMERRLFTAGEHKGFLDPFLPLNPKEVAHVERLLGEIHEQFVEAVRNGRGERLADDPALFSGLFWTGQEALELGLIDGFADETTVARELIGVDKIREFSHRRDWWERLGERIGSVLATRLEERLWPGEVR